MDVKFIDRKHLSLDDIDLLDHGITAIKSLTGTAKTTIIREHVRRLPAGASVLLVGHRVNLIEATCKFLGLEFYRDVQREKPVIGNRVGICLDSLLRLCDENDRLLRNYDLILLDESDQVISHFKSSTMQQHKPVRTFAVLGELSRGANQIVAMDANLSEISLETLQDLAPDKPVRVYYNEYKRPQNLEIFYLETHLLADMEAAVRAGQRIFMATNSRKKCEEYHAQFKDRDILLITSETSKTPAVRAFLVSPSMEALKYQAIFCSPSIGTGVDLTFKDAVSGFEINRIDAVYGFFLADITTHFETDQHLSRVRKPKVTKVWIDPVPLNLATGIKDLLKDADYPLPDDDVPLVKTGNSYIDALIRIDLSIRNSKNFHRENYIALKKSQGTTPDFVKIDKGMVADGRERKKASRELSLEEHIKAHMAAPVLDKDAFQKLDLLDRGIPDDRQKTAPPARLMTKPEPTTLTAEEKRSLRRARVERFFRRPISEDLLRLDHAGYQGKVECLEAALGYSATGITFDLGGFDTAAKVVSSDNRAAYIINILLSATPLLRAGEMQADAAISASDLTHFAAICQANKYAIETAFDTRKHLRIRENVADDPMKQVVPLLACVGLSLKALGRRKAINGKRERHYKLDHAALKAMMQVILTRMTEI